MRRMDRYKETSEHSRISRENQNQELYDSIGGDARYTDISDVTNANAIDLGSTKNYKTREGYHQIKEYQNVVPTPRVKKELEDFKSIYQNRENKVYDINNVLEEARKNRVEKDELEEKRKLKNTSYNILASLNPEELEKYRQEKKDKIIHPSEEELKDLIDTITSRTLAGDLQAASDLLSDLMATNILDKVERAEESSEEDTDLYLSKNLTDIDKIESGNEEATKEDEKETEDIKDDEKESTADIEFYTRSMDLSDQDFDLEEEFKDKKMSLGMKVLIFLILLAICAAVFYFIWKQI